MDLKDFAFTQMYAALTSDLAILTQNHIKCTRKRCADPSNCGFIPNYPVIHFEAGSRLPSYPWVALSDIHSLLDRIVAAKELQVKKG